MIYYINFGFIIEQALCDVVKRYMDRQNFDDVYGNFHISVVNEHPFAHMIIDDHARAADNFPAVVITSQSDSKPNDLTNVPPQITGIGLTSDDFDSIIASTKRVKTKIDEDGEVVPVQKGGHDVIENIPGLVLVTDNQRIEKLKEIADSRTEGEKKGCIYGIKISTQRRDHISVEIWAENNQLKNEIYEHLRLMFVSSLERVLEEQYPMFNCGIFDLSVNGERSSNYNFDFDTLLCGSHITFDVDYDVSQLILDSSITNINKEIIWEVINHVKE